MIHLSTGVIVEFFIGLIFWWVAIYLFTRNPFSRLVQVIAAMLAVMSVYITSDLFFFVADVLKSPHLSGQMIKYFNWAIYLPGPFLYHASYLLIDKGQRKKWQKIFLYIAYLLAFVIIYLESATNLTRNYNLLNSLEFVGNYANATGKYFWITAIYYSTILIMTGLNFFYLLKKQVKGTNDWYKYFWPLIGLIIGILVSPFIVLSYYNIIFRPYFYDGAIGMLILGGTFVYSTLRYNLLVKEAKMIFDKSFVYSSLVMVFIVVIYLLVISGGRSQLTTFNSFITPFILLHLIIATHPMYDWISTFTRDLVYNISSGISVVNDTEVYDAIRNYNRLQNLEGSTLLRLNILSKRFTNTEPVEGLRSLVRDSIEYFKPEEDSTRRTKRSLKYQLLKMIAFDQAEEGQILWELGFEDYPVRIMNKENEGREPLFKITSASDYIYTSRNSFIALKKEAIHDVAWKISYLEKRENKKF